MLFTSNYDLYTKTFSYKTQIITITTSTIVITIYYNNIACARRHGCISFTAPPPALRTVLTVALTGTTTAVHRHPLTMYRPAQHRHRGGLRSPTGRWSISASASAAPSAAPGLDHRRWCGCEQRAPLYDLKRIRQSSRSTSRVSIFSRGWTYVIYGLG